MPLDRRHMLVIFGAQLLTLALPAQARRGRGGDGDGDHRDDDDSDDFDFEEADKARRSGEIRPLQEILAEVQKVHQGEVVGIKFDKEDGVWVYEIKMIALDGRYVELYVDAKTAQVIKIEGK